MKTTELLMMSNPVTCQQSDSANHAARLMWDHDIGALPVVDGDGRLCGMVTDRDLCMAAYTQGKPLAAIDVSTSMAREVISVGAHDDASRVAELMAQHRVRRLPVVDDERRPVGIISLHDLAGRSDVAPGALVSEHEVASTLRAICTPHGLPAVPPARTLPAKPTSASPRATQRATPSA
jgi:CBS domain-containing protein